jgi:hypothetical protein
MRLFELAVVRCIRHLIILFQREDRMTIDSGKPEPLNEWSGEMILVYPSGEQSHMDTTGSVVRPGEPFPGKPGYVLDRLDLSEEPRADGRYMVVGILRKTDS